MEFIPESLRTVDKILMLKLEFGNGLSERKRGRTNRPANERQMPTAVGIWGAFAKKGSAAASTVRGVVPTNPFIIYGKREVRKGARQRYQGRHCFCPAGAKACHVGMNRMIGD
jgi:hypothetical protein